MPPTTLPLDLFNSITLSRALKHEHDILGKLSYPEKRLDFACSLYVNRDTIKAIMSHHLRVPLSSCQIPLGKGWIDGTYNMCVPVTVGKSDEPPVAKYMIRFPLPYKIGETSFPGNIEEKLRCEAATYAYLQDHCPDIPIPRLFGFGLPSGGPSFTALDHAPILSRLAWNMRRCFAWLLGRPLSSHFVYHPHQQAFEPGYLLMEYISRGSMLSKSWEAGRKDPHLRANLFGDLARIVHRLSQHQFSRIGSLSIDDNCIVNLTNRPLTMYLHELENEGIPTGIPRDRTYERSDSYVLDVLACHDNRLRCHPNAINSEEDGNSQFAVLTAMRALVPNFLQAADHSDQQFALQLTDLHSSNVFVDEDYRITYLLDLEWACVRPINMLHPPQLLGFTVDQKGDEKSMAPYISVLDEFASALEEAELEDTVRSDGTHPSEIRGDTRGSSVMRTGLRTGSAWFFLALESYSGLYDIFYEHVRQAHGAKKEGQTEKLESALAPYWQLGGVKALVASKMVQWEKYMDDIRQLFAVEEQKELARLEKEQKKQAAERSEAQGNTAAQETQETQEAEHGQTTSVDQDDQETQKTMGSLET